MKKSPQKKDPLDGKVGYLLIATILVQFLYPISISDSVWVLIAFQIFYISLFVAGIYLVSSNQLHKRILIGATVLWLISGATFAFNPDLQWLNFAIYIILLFFMISLTGVLIRYIFQSTSVNFDVLLAACTVYLLLGGIFATLFNFIEVLTWFPEQTSHAFVDGLNPDAYKNEIFPWQTIVYYSYATLTTLGYGDVLPLTPWARTVAAFEAVVGVLYTAVIVARLVGLYAANEVEEEFKGEREKEEREMEKLN
ncbi:MAG: voltage-gated potassium channel Kch [Cellvibrionaceae bacterium]|jgi:voltage-gated potassium channel Kch